MQNDFGCTRHVSRCVLSLGLAHLAHSARAANVAQLARVGHVAHLANVEPAAHLAHQARLARLGLWGAWRTRCERRTWGLHWFPLAVHPMAIAAYAESRVLLMWWEGGWELARRLVACG